MENKEISYDEIMHLMKCFTSKEFEQIILKWMYTYNEIIIKRK